MKFKLVHLFFIVLFATASAQNPVVVGEKFDFDSKYEQDAQLVLKDNYNHYLFTVTNRDGMLANHQIILRKFDQKNQLVNTYSQDFAINMFTLHNYLGGFELSNDKFVAFINSYSNKTSKTELYQYVFDKTTGKFTATVIASYPIVSLSKSGNFSISKSENNQFLELYIKNTTLKKSQKKASVRC